MDGVENAVDKKTLNGQSSVDGNQVSPEVENADNSSANNTDDADNPENGDPGDFTRDAQDGDVNNTDTPESNASEQPSQPWQAVFSPQYNAYYFYNTLTNETTWTNPLLQPPAPPSPGPTSESSSSQYVAPRIPSQYAAALAQGIDPDLAHLDPSLSAVSSFSSASPSAIPTFQAKFNARTGAFTRPDARDPSHLSEHERARRMSEFYFDVSAWEQELESRGGRNRPQDGEEEGSEEGSEGRKKRKRPTKKDVERFKEQKRLKKIAKTAWLRT